MATDKTHFNATTAHTFFVAFARASADNAHIAANCTPVHDLIAREALDVGKGLTNDYYVSEDHLSGFIVRHDGELCAVFSSVKGRGAQLLAHAKYRGATHLDCFEGYLSRFYAQHGFIEVGSEQNYNGPDHPRVVFFALRG